MLVSLRIRNLALVDDIALEFPGGYIALTGETGAGKSVLLGALGLLLGDRADRTMIRSGQDSCTVEAVFNVRSLGPEFHQLLANRGLEGCEDDLLFLKRTFSVIGGNRQFVNGSPTQLQSLDELGDSLVDLHGAHEHQSLLQTTRQLHLLDAFGDSLPLRAQFAALVQRRRAILEQRRELEIEEGDYTRRLDLLRHQVAEIDGAALQPDEEEEISREHQRAANAARLLELGQTAYQQLADDESSLSALSGNVGRTLSELCRIDPQAAPLADLHRQLAGSLQELESDLRRYLDQTEVDPERLQALEERFGLLQSLKRKYGSSVADILRFGEEARRQLRQLESRDVELQALDRQLQVLDADLRKTGTRLTAHRHKQVPRLARAISAELAELGFKQSDFEIALTPTAPNLLAPDTQLSPDGFDRVEFLFSPNPGEPPRPLRAIASSGEIARVMLAIRTVLASQDAIPVLVFDEIDANIGGEVAHAVGRKMRRLGQCHQVLCITHLAPVAAAAPTHFTVTKLVNNQRTRTEVALLSPEGRVAELARMLGGRTHEAQRLATALLETNSP